MNRFITTNDKKINWDLNNEWWSRPYEYYFAYHEIDKDDVIIDAGCGIEHPFKIYATRKAKKVYAVDSDIRILDMKPVKKIEYIHGDLTKLDQEVKEKVDKIFCISVLEHMKESILLTLQAFKNCLKKDGEIILTVDYPTITPIELIELAKSSGLSIIGDLDYIRKENLITGYNLNVFTMILEAGEIIAE